MDPNTIGFKFEGKREVPEMRMLHIFCHGSSYSFNIIKDALEDFSNVTGLQPNMSKSNVFLLKCES